MSESHSSSPPATRHGSIAETLYDLVSRTFVKTPRSEQIDEAIKHQNKVGREFDVDTNAAVSWLEEFRHRSLGDLIAPFVVYPQEDSLWKGRVFLSTSVNVSIWPNGQVSGTLPWVPYQKQSAEVLVKQPKCKVKKGGEGLRRLLWELRRTWRPGMSPTGLHAYYYQDFYAFQKIKERTERPGQYDARLGMRSLLEIPILGTGTPVAVLIFYSPIRDFLGIAQNGSDRVQFGSLPDLADRVNPKVAALLEFAELATAYTAPEPISTSLTYLEDKHRLTRQLLDLSKAVSEPTSLRAGRTGPLTENLDDESTSSRSIERRVTTDGELGSVVEHERYALKFASMSDLDRGVDYVIRYCPGAAILRTDVLCVRGDVLLEFDRRSISYDRLKIDRHSTREILSYFDSLEKPVGQ